MQLNLLSERYVVALSGGIASGKSAVTSIFVECGVAVYDADLAARAVVAPGEPALDEIASAFGSDALTATGELNRKAMRERVFTDVEARKRLEAILHPRVKSWLQSKVLADRGAYCVLAIPLLVETWPDYRWVDRVLIVDVDEEVQLSRLTRRDQIGSKLALKMLRAQASRSERAAIADDVVDNSGTLAELRIRVAVLDQRYRELAAHKRFNTGEN